MKWLIITVIFTLLTMKSAKAAFNELETRLRAFEIEDRLIEMRAYTTKMKNNTLETKYELLNNSCNIGTGLILNPLIVSIMDSIKEVKTRGLDPKNCTELFDSIVNEFLAHYNEHEPMIIIGRFFMMSLDMDQRIKELTTIWEYIHHNLDGEINKCKRAEEECPNQCVCAIDEIFDDILISNDPIRNSYLIFKMVVRKSRKFFKTVVRDPFSLILLQTVAFPVRSCLRALEPL